MPPDGVAGIDVGDAAERLEQQWMPFVVRGEDGRQSAHLDLPELRDYLQTLLRNRERILAATDLDEWAATEATPSEDEITRLRALIRRTEEAVEDLSVAEQGALQEATAA